MGVYIKSMEMPKDCRECPMQVYYSSGKTWCKSTDMILAEDYKPIPFDGRPKWCPLVEVPEPHGRLIDTEMLMDDVKKNSASFFAEDFAREWLDVQPTVIEAEGG
jgi:hypothetical protein